MVLMEVQMLRPDIYNILFTVINLLIIFAIIRVFLFKPIHNILAKRQEEIDKQYADAKAAEEKANSIKEEYEANLNSVEDEKVKVVNDARAKASAEYDRIVSDAKSEADKLIENAKKTAELEQARSVKMAKEQIEELVIAATKKVVASGQGAEADRELYNQFLKETGEEN